GLFAGIGPSRKLHFGLTALSAFRFSKVPCSSQNFRMSRSRAGKSTFWVSTRANGPSVGFGVTASATASTPRAVGPEPRRTRGDRFSLVKDTRARQSARAARKVRTTAPTLATRAADRPQTPRRLSGRPTDLSESPAEPLHSSKLRNFSLPLRREQDAELLLPVRAVHP